MRDYCENTSSLGGVDGVLVGLTWACSTVYFNSVEIDRSAEDNLELSVVSG